MKLSDYYLKIRHFSSQNRNIILLLSFYFLLRIINLTLLPIFNDEAIYLDWAWRETHTPGNLYYSLYDGKQPLLMWIFGIFETLLKDPLFAGRLVSVLAGFFSLLGIYTISRLLFNRQTATLASVLYIIIPIFSFYDRQALMESAISAVGIWSVYYTIRLLSTPTQKYAIILGLLIGLGLFIKSSAILFLISITSLTSYSLLKSNNRKLLIRLLGIMMCSIIVTDFLLLINSQFWQTLSMNSRYTLTIGELFKFPFSQWGTNLLANLEINFFYLTPLVVVSGLIGAILIFRKNNVNNKMLIIFFLITIILEIFFARIIQQRYIVSYLPLFTIFSGYFLAYIIHINRRWGILITTAVFLLPLILTIIQITNPPKYFSLMSKLTRFSDEEKYVTDMTSGYGIDEVIAQLDSKGHGKIILGTALNSGNPESGLIVLTLKNTKIKFSYLDTILFGNSLKKIDCLKSATPVFFVSREEQQGGLNKYLEQVTFVKNPYGTNRIGIYQLKKKCSGKTIDINPNFKP